MPLDIKDTTKNFDLKHPSGAVFTLRHWTLGMQEVVDKECLISDGTGGFKWNVSRERAIKIEQCLVGWDGVERDGSPLPFTAQSAKELPVGIVMWLVKEIDEDAGLRMTETEKKS